ncbi:MAG TPA: substrate-binding domain-containing protein [Clostridiaceae bacterium]|nr:substrate-binding domain-containing protein [Clostridiaceae bacterium]
MSRFETIGKSKQFYEFLKNEIMSGEYKPGEKFPSIRNLAEKYGISKITVNSVISNLVNEGLLYVEQGKGTFVAHKNNLTGQSKRIIGVMLIDFSLENNVEALMFNSIQKELKDNYFLVPYNSFNKSSNFYKGLKGFIDLEVDGMILVPPTPEDYDEGEIRKIVNKNISTVIINREISSIKADYLYVDFTESVYLGTRTMLDRGKEKIALILNNSPSVDRRIYEGYERAHLEKNLEIDRNMVKNWPDEIEIREQDLEEFVRSIDGLIGSDYIIHKFRKAINNVDKRIPEDISILGINDTIYSKFMTPPLTAVAYPSEKVGVEALRLLMDQIENGRKENVKKSIKPELIYRLSL